MGVRENIVEYCRDNIGCDYDYTPSGGIEGESYNCSYLTFCAYRFAGCDIPSWQGHQNGNGSQSDWVFWNAHWTTDPGELKPGDLVFFGRSRVNTQHVGVSLGGRRMIDSVPDGGVQERYLYDSFVGGGWPLEWYPEEEQKKEVVIPPMDCIISIVDMNTVIAIVGGQVHDLTDPDDIRVLDMVWGATHGGDMMPRMQMEANWYARLVQVFRAGYPAHLREFNDLFPPRS